LHKLTLVKIASSVLIVGVVRVINKST